MGNCGKAGVSIYMLWGSLASSLVIILALVSCVVISYYIIERINNILNYKSALRLGWNWVGDVIVDSY